MKLLIYTANLNNFDKTQLNEEQLLPGGIDSIEYWRCTDEDFPLRDKAMTPRLQARIPKMFAWQMKPGYDYYLWLDSSCRLAKEDSAKWFMEQLGQANIAVFKHPTRDTVQEEANYLKERLELEKSGRKQPYVLPRYENEDTDGQLAAVDPSAPLYASTAFIYKDSPLMQLAMKEWWYQTSRYHSIDQLSLPWAIKGLKVNVIPDKYMECPYLEYTR